MKEIKDYIATVQKLLQVGNSISFTEAEKRAGVFLEASAKLIDWKHLLSEEKIKLLSVQSVTYSEELSKASGKTITENKITVEASPIYTAARENFEMLENNISYLKAYLDLFNNAHIFYRNMAKGDNS